MILKSFPVLRAAAVLAFALASPAGAEPLLLAESVPTSIEVAETANRAFRLLKPLATGTSFPLVVYLHSAGAKGSDNLKPANETLPKLLATAEMRTQFPCFVLAPQCRDGEDAKGLPNNWVKWENQKTAPPAQWLKSEEEPSDQLRAAMAALDHVLATQPGVDRARIYLAGVSMGGSGALNWAAREPGRFAGLIAVCSLNEPARAPALAKARLPVWIFHGEKDEVAPVERARKMVSALKEAEAPVQFTEYAGAGHNIAEKVFSENQHAALHWLFGQRQAENP